MSFQYRFTHSKCGHIGIGPVIRSAPQFPSTTQQSSDDASIPPPPPSLPSQICLHLHFLCPFCHDTGSFLDIHPGTGILCELVSSFHTLFPTSWKILKIGIRSEELTTEDWKPVYEVGEGGGFRQMAWIPRPGGKLEDLGDERQEISSSWKQRVGRNGEGVKSRLAGMLSDLNSAVSKAGNGKGIFGY